ncbi:MAG: hypothetical protein WC375_09160 [Methanomassiliicoccales archaeon]|jgi:hypothetical protein
MEEGYLRELSKFEAILSQQEGVSATGIGIGQNGQPCIKIYTNHMSAEVKQQISLILTDVYFEFEEIGEINKQI